MLSENERLLRIGEVLEIAGISKSVLYEMVNREEFPRPVRIGRRSVGWRQREVKDWLDSLPPATQDNWR